MSTYELFDLLFSGGNLLLVIISGIFALWTKSLNNKANSSLKDTQKIANKIKNYSNSLINKRNLTDLTLIQSQVNEIRKEFTKLREKENNNVRDFQTTDVFNTYSDIKIKIMDIKNKVPVEYKDIIDELYEVMQTLNYCSDNNITLNHKDRSIIRDYSTVDMNLENAINKIKGTIEPLNWE